MRVGSLVKFLPTTADGSYMSTKIKAESCGIVLGRRAGWCHIMFNFGNYDIKQEDLREVSDAG